MDPAVRFGVLLLPNVPWDVLRERVIRVERLGFDVAGIADHFVDWTNPPNPWLESWTVLTGLAGATTSIRLATCVTQIAFRNPAVFARQALTLDHISGGRLEIGLGTGLVGDPSYAMTGIPDWDPKERVARLGEYAEVVDRLLRDEVTTFDGVFYRVDGAIMNPRPVQSPRPPITIAALGPVMMRHAARTADVWSSLSFRATFDVQLDEDSRSHRPDGRRVRAGSDAIPRRSGGRSRCTTPPPDRAAGRTTASPRSSASKRWSTRCSRWGWTRSSSITRPTSDRLSTFERIATDVLPRLRARRATV